jgi:hypothetical protein
MYVLIVLLCFCRSSAEEDSKQHHKQLLTDAKHGSMHIHELRLKQGSSILLQGHASLKRYVRNCAVRVFVCVCVCAC